MNRVRRWTGPLIGMAMIAAGFLTPRAAAVEPLAPDEWQDAAAYEQGKSRACLTAIEAEVTAALADPAKREPVLGELGRLVKSEEATFGGRLFACRQLARIGGEESVPALARLLRDEQLSSGARYALQRIPAEAAAAALRGALAGLEGTNRIGVINSLGERRDAAAVPLVASMLPEMDLPTARAAVEMMGKVGDERAAEILLGLERAREPGNGPALNLLADAILRCGDHLAEAGKDELAAELFAAVAGENHRQHVRIAGLQGLAFLRPVETAVTVVELLGSRDPVWSGTAARLIATAPGEDATDAYAELLPLLESEGQIRLLGALAERGDPGATAAILPLLLVDDWPLARAAIDALGRTGGPSAVPALALLATNGVEEARASLHAMRAPGVDAAIVAAILAEEIPDVRVELAAALGARRAFAEAPALVSIATNDSVMSVRIAALEALGLVAGEPELQTMILLLTRAEAAYETAAAIEAVAATCLRIEDREQRSALVVAALEWARGSSKAALLRVIGRIGGEEALFALFETLTEGGEVTDAGCEALAEWPDGELAEALLVITRHTEGAAHRAAFEGLVHTASLPAERSAEETAELFREAFELAESDAMKRQALGGLARVAHADALDLAVQYLGAEPTREQAALATVAIAGALGEGSYDVAIAAVHRALEACPTSLEVRERAGEVIDVLERGADYITAWRFAGPYQREDTSGTAIFDVPYPPEPGGPIGVVDWQEVPAAAIEKPGRIDLNKIALGGNRCGYLACRITSEQDQGARLELGTDDGLKVWWNGELVHENNVMRGLTPGSDVVLVDLKRGANALLLKVTQGGGDWAATCRLRSAEGYHLGDVEIAAPE